jgi:hypothetical protein
VEAGIARQVGVGVNRRGRWFRGARRRVVLARPPRSGLACSPDPAPLASRGLPSSAPAPPAAPTEAPCYSAEIMSASCRGDQTGGASHGSVVGAAESSLSRRATSCVDADDRTSGNTPSGG